jgi:hypothetical protein
MTRRPMRSAGRFAWVCAASMLAACGTLREEPRPETQRGTAKPAPPAQASAPSGSEAAAAAAAAAAKRPGSLARQIDPKKLAAQLSLRPLDIAMSCSFRNESGFNGEASVNVANGSAKSLKMNVNIPERGACVFDMSGFRQTHGGSMVELRHPADGCTVRMWEQGRQVTVAFSECAARCAPASAFQYVWPMLIDRPSKRCD